MLRNTTRRRMGLALAGAVSLALVSIIVSAGSSSTFLPNGAELAVSIDDPVTCTEFQVPHDQTTIDVSVTGTASVGLGEPDGTLVYVIDVSGSTIATSAGGDCGGDINGDGDSNTVLDCEAAAVLALNAAAISGGSVDEVGVAVYGEGGAAGDMTPGGGDDPITAPDADSHVATVVQSVQSSDVIGPACVAAGLSQYTPKAVGCDGTNFAAGLAAAKTVVDAGTNGTEIVVYLSDGVSNAGTPDEFDGNLADLVGTGAVIYSFAVGASSSCGGGSAGTLQQMADASFAANGAGECTEIVTPADLPNILPDLIGSSLDELSMSVDGGGAVTIPNSDISLPLPQPGAVSVNYTTVAAGLDPDDHEICVTADGSDATGGTADVTQCETIHLLQLDYGDGVPAEDTNDLNFDNSHTVTVQIAGGTGPDRIVDFEVTGTNAGPTDSVLVPAPGSGDFTYSVPQECASLGTDTITATALIAGVEDSITFTKEWIDTVPPDVSCDPSVNPSGRQVPPATNTNPDGFYQLNSADFLECEVELMVVDGDGFVFPGPFDPGDTIKYTQDDSIPQEQKKIGGPNSAVRWHLIGHGDLTVHSTDISDNTASAVCLVPPPPR